MLNPYSTFVKLWIGDKEFCNDEDHIIDLKMDMQAPKQNGQGCSKVTVNLYDQTGLLVENAILSQPTKERKFKYQFGYVGGQASDVYEAVLLTYGAQFNAKGTTVTLDGQATTNAEALKKQVRPITKSYEGKISDVVRKLAEENDWVIDNIVDTLPLPDNDGKEIYRCDNCSPVDFILKTLTTLARSSNTKFTGHYVFNLQPKKGKNHIVFQPIDYKDENAKEESVQFIVGQPSDKIISFSPDYAQSAYAILGGNGAKSTTNNKQSGEPLKYDTYKGSLEASTEDAIVLDGSSYDAASIEAISKNMFSKMQMASYPAQLETVGDLELQPFDYINISVLLPNNVIHHSSGKYWIMTISHNISGGSFTTSYELIRATTLDKAKQTANANSKGNNKGSTTSKAGNKGGVTDEEAKKMTYIGPRGVPYGTQELYDSINPQGETAIDRFRDMEGKMPHMSYDGTNCMRSVSMALGDDTPYKGCVNTDTAQSIAKKNGEWESYDFSKLEPGDTIIVNDGHAIMWTGDGIISNGWSKNGITETSNTKPEDYGTPTCILKTSKYN